MKGTLPEEEMSALPPSIEIVESPELHVPGVDAARHLIVMRKRANRA